MLQKRKAVQPLRGSNSTKRLRKPVCFDSWFDSTIRLKEQHALDEFESMLMEKCHNRKVDVDDRAMCAYELALLYCQQGHFARADHLLHELGFKYRIGKDLWSRQDAVRHSSAISDGKLACYDDVLPQCFLSRLLEAFSPDSSFWSDHEYPTDSFFSYNTKIQSDESSRKKSLKSKSTKKGESETSRSNGENLIAQLANYLKPLVRASFPDKNIEDIRSVEWWAHTRPNGPAAGHRVSSMLVLSAFFFLLCMHCSFITTWMRRDCVVWKVSKRSLIPVSTLVCPVLYIWMMVVVQEHQLSLLTRIYKDLAVTELGCVFQRLQGFFFSMARCYTELYLILTHRALLMELD